MKNQEPIVIECDFSRAATTADGGWKISFDTGEQMAHEVMKIASLKGQFLYLIVMTEDQYKNT